MFDQLKERKWWFIAGAPVCFVVVYACMLLVPNKYKSTFVIARETEQAVETNRAMTLNMPSHYDLGVARTDNAISEYGYGEVIKSDAFIELLLDATVSTDNGDFEGSYRTYLLTRAPRSIVDMITHPKRKVMPDTNPAERRYTKQEVNLIIAVRKQLSIRVNSESRNVTISITTADPRISTMLAERMNTELNRFVRTYEQEKMQLATEQLQAHVQQAETDYLAAKAAKQDNQNEKKEVLQSFQRQLVVYKAQNIYHPAYTTLSQPSYTYKKSSPHRTTTAMAITILYIFVLICVVYKKELLSRI